MNTEFQYKNTQNKNIPLTLDNDRITKIKNDYNGMKNMYNDNEKNNDMVKDISIHVNLTDKIKSGSINQLEFQNLTNSIKESIWDDKPKINSNGTRRKRKTTSGGKNIKNIKNRKNRKNRKNKTQKK